MRRAIQLGANALGTAAPNPMVGAVLVYNDKIIGEGFTSPFGGPHAEVNAIESVADKDLLSKSTLYVSLEPCAHFGKTPPCTQMIIKCAIPEVVIGIRDPHEKVAGKGVEELEAAGCKVVSGVLEDACREHHKRFLCVHEKMRPYIILKWAQSADGFLAPMNFKREQKRGPYWISNKHCRQLVHQWRSQEQAILVGSSTVLQDNPQLNTRLWKGKSPLRVILDKDLEILGSYHVLDRSQPTLILTEVANKSRYIEGISYKLLDYKGLIEAQCCEILKELHCNSLIVEGGAQTLTTFIEAGCWDEARIFTGPMGFGNGLKAPLIEGLQIAHKQIGDTSLRILRHD